MKRFLILSLLGIVMVSMRSLAAQQDSEDLTEAYFMDELPVVLSASRLAQPISESPAAMTIIDRELIEASGAINIPDVLRLVPGVQVSHISGSNLTAQYHGLADQYPKRMQVLIDGRSVYHSAFGGVHWDTLPFTLNDIERIEVLRGSNASTYGSNAFMGVINIVTRHSSKDRGHQVTLMGGYANTNLAEWRYGGGEGDLSYRLTMSGFSADGFPSYTSTHDYWDSTGVVPASDVPLFTPYLGAIEQRSLERRDDQDIGRFNLRADYRFDNGDDLLFEIGYTHNNRENSLIRGTYDELRPNEDLESSFQFLKWSRNTRQNSHFSLQFSHNRLRFSNEFTEHFIYRNDDLLINLGPVTSGGEMINDRYDLEFQHTPEDMDGWRTVWGMGLRLDQIKGNDLLIDGDDYQREQFRVFANTEKHFGDDDQWVLNAGVMIEHQDDHGTFTSPRMAISHHLDEQTTLRVAASRAYRMPSMFEQYREVSLYSIDPPAAFGIPPYHYKSYSNVGQDVEPEQMTTYEAGLFAVSLQQHVSFDIRLFLEQLRGYIGSVTYQNACVDCDTAPAALGLTPHDLQKYENSGWMDIRGVDLQTRYTPSDRSLFVHSLSLTSAQGKRNKTRDASGAVVSANVTDMDAFIP